MKTLLLTTLLLGCMSVGMGQTKLTDSCKLCTAPFYSTSTGSFDITPKVDTIEVIAFCIDTTTLKTKFRKLYAIYGWNYPSVNFNGLTIYKQYLMPDRKTKSIYKIIYSLTK